MARRKPKPEPWSPWVARLDEIFLRDGEYVEPLSDRWRQARRGRLTASERALVIADRSPVAWNSVLDAVNDELLPEYQCREITGVPAMEWGREHEKAAIANIELADGVDLVEPGLVFHERYPFVAATPDAFLDDDISIQIKCPYNPKNHLQVLYEKTLRPVYYCQVQWEAWVSKRSKIRFYSFDPRQPLATQLVRLDIPVNKEMLDKFDAGVRDFAEMLVKGGRMATGRARPMGVPSLL